MCLVIIMKKNMLGKLLKNKILLYVVVAFATLNVLGYFSMRSWECIVLFSATAYSVNCYGKNMTVALLAGLFVSNFVFGCNRVKENFEEAYTPLKKAEGLKNKAKKEAMKKLEDLTALTQEGFATREGAANMGNIVELMKTLNGADKGTQKEGDAAKLEQVINGFGGMKGIVSAFTKMNL